MQSLQSSIFFPKPILFPLTLKRTTNFMELFKIGFDRNYLEKWKILVNVFIHVITIKDILYIQQYVKTELEN